MAIQVVQVKRVFKYNGIKLADVPGMSVEEVRDIYARQYDELLTSVVEVGEIVNGIQEYKFVRAVGTKG